MGYSVGHVQSTYQFDLRDLNFSNIQDASYDSRLSADSDIAIFGKTYSDTYIYR